MPLTNCKIELKVKWTNHCVLPEFGADNADANSNNIIFTIKCTKVYIPVVTLSAKGNEKLSKILSKVFGRSVYCDKHKKRENKDMKNEHSFFLESNFSGVNRLFVLVCPNQDDNPKRYKAEIYNLSKGIIKNYNVIINGKNVYE